MPVQSPSTQALGQGPPMAIHSFPEQSSTCLPLHCVLFGSQRRVGPPPMPPVLLVVPPRPPLLLSWPPLLEVSPPSPPSPPEPSPSAASAYWSSSNTSPDLSTTQLEARSDPSDKTNPTRTTRKECQAAMLSPQ